MNSNCKNKCRFKYSYVRKPKNKNECCEPKICTTDEFINSISSLPMVVNNNTRTSEQSLLLAAQQQYLQNIYTTNVNSTLQYVNQNSSAITSTIYGELLNIKEDRFLPYKPYIYPTMPPSVMELQMNTANVGVPHSFFTIANCKGSQSVTTSDVILN